MNDKISVGQSCRVYQYDPNKENAHIYIEGVVKEVDLGSGIYDILCTKDASVSDEKLKAEPELRSLSRQGKRIAVPIAPDSGDFPNRICLI